MYIIYIYIFTLLRFQAVNLRAMFGPWWEAQLGRSQAQAAVGRLSWVQELTTTSLFSLTVLTGMMLRKG